jgi:hypothetical protein
MRQRIIIIPFLIVLLLTSCTWKKSRVIFRPDPVQDILQEQTGSAEIWQIIESQNGPGEIAIPEWVNRYYNRELRVLEASETYGERYLFVGRNRGDNFIALQQWLESFNVRYDFPALVTQRTERRLVASASLYPDDEYGDYFAKMIKEVTDSEFPGASVVQNFWVKRKMINNNDEVTDIELPEANTEQERYEFLVLTSIDKETFQRQIREIMAGIKTTESPTREQTAAVTKIRQSFFEGF